MLCFRRLREHDFSFSFYCETPGPEAYSISITQECCETILETLALHAQLHSVSRQSAVFRTFPCELQAQNNHEPGIFIRTSCFDNITTLCRVSTDSIYREWPNTLILI